MNRTLDPAKIIGTAEKLELRIAERFPGSGLARLGTQLTAVTRQTPAHITSIARPNIALRVLLAAVLAAILGLTGLLVTMALDLGLETPNELSAVMQGLDAAVNLMIVIGGASFFLFTLESRIRRGRTLAALHELRSIIHVIDMHQLTKDPSALGSPRTSSSPGRLTPGELRRYLDYCTELLSIAGKVAALYAERVSDPVVIDAVGDIERLTTNMSQKIWQKITMIPSGEGPKAIV